MRLLRRLRCDIDIPPRLSSVQHLKSPDLPAKTPSRGRRDERSPANPVRRDFQVDLLTVRCKIAEFGAKNAGARAGFDL
jgi:hypothetical protein